MKWLTRPLQLSDVLRRANAEKITRIGVSRVLASTGRNDLNDWAVHEFDFVRGPRLSVRLNHDVQLDVRRREGESV